MTKIKVQIKQTLFSRFLINLAAFLYFYGLINYQLYLQIIDMALLDIKAFKLKIAKGKWRYFKVGDYM